MTTAEVSAVSASGGRGDGTTPKVVVLLAAYNGVGYLGPQVQSILGQTDVSVTLVISVDESTDGTRDWVASLSLKEPRVQLRPDIGRLGSASANFFNLMCEVSVDGFDFVALADQDDYWLPGKLSRAIQAMRNTNSVGYSGSVWAWYDDGSLRRVNKAGRQRRWDHLFSSPGPGCTHALRADIFAGLQQTLRDHRSALSGIVYHDWLDYAYVRQQGHSWFIDPTPQMLYRQHSSNQLGANIGLGAKIRRAAELRRGWMRQQALLICEVVGAQNTTPCKLLMGTDMLSRLALVGLSPRLRRNLRDAAVLAVFFLLLPPRRSSDE